MSRLFSFNRSRLGAYSRSALGARGTTITTPIIWTRWFGPVPPVFMPPVLLPGGVFALDKNYIPPLFPYFNPIDRRNTVQGIDVGLYPIEGLSQFLNHRPKYFSSLLWCQSNYHTYMTEPKSAPEFRLDITMEVWWPDWTKGSYGPIIASQQDSNYIYLTMKSLRFDLRWNDVDYRIILSASWQDHGDGTLVASGDHIYFKWHIYGSSYGPPLNNELVSNNWLLNAYLLDDVLDKTNSKLDKFIPGYTAPPFPVFSRIAAVDVVNTSFGVHLKLDNFTDITGDLTTPAFPDIFYSRMNGHVFNSASLGYFVGQYDDWILNSWGYKPPFDTGIVVEDSQNYLTGNGWLTANIPLDLGLNFLLTSFFGFVSFQYGPVVESLSTVDDPNDFSGLYTIEPMYRIPIGGHAFPADLFSALNLPNFYMFGEQPNIISPDTLNLIDYEFTFDIIGFYNGQPVPYHPIPYNILTGFPNLIVGLPTESFINYDSKTIPFQKIISYNSQLGAQGIGRPNTNFIVGAPI